MKAYFAKRIVGEDKVYENAYLLVDNDKVVDIVNEVNDDVEVIDYKDYTIIPGIFDIHSHGRFGYSGTAKSDEELFGYTKGMAASGVTTMFPAVMYAPEEFPSIERIVNVIERNEAHGARILGIHAEGPYRAEEYMGASKGFVWPKPSLEYTQKMLDVSKGHMKYISISPELPGAYEAMDTLIKNGVKVALGHTGVSYEEMNKGFDKGAVSVTHFGNAIKFIHQRNANAVGATLLRDDILIELICDHVHVCKETIDIFMRFKDIDHILLMSDSNEIAGLPEGKYWARGRERFIDSEGNIRIFDGTLSGSGRDILYGIKNMVKYHNVSLSDACKMAGYNQAKLFGYLDTIGSLKSGKHADFVVIDDEYDVLKTYREGEVIYDKKDREKLYNPDMKKMED